MHVGICRSANTDESAVAQNIKKARRTRTMYSLMSAGLDPETSLHLYQIYVLPMLLYGMEVVFPRPKFDEVLEKFNKHNLKHIMSLPVTAADPAVYILSVASPVEAMIHQRLLNFFENICRLSESLLEKQLAVRQVAVKKLDSNSWFVAVKNCVSCTGFLVVKMSWMIPKPKRRGRKPCKEPYVTTGQSFTVYHPTISEKLVFNATELLKRHPLIKSSGNLHEVPRIAVHLKIVTGTYILQTNTQSFNQNQVTRHACYVKPVTKQWVTFCWTVSRHCHHQVQWATCAAWLWRSVPHSEGEKTPMVWTCGMLQWCSQNSLWHTGW